MPPGLVGTLHVRKTPGKTLRVSWRPRLLSRVQSAMASYTPLLSLSRPHRRTTRGGGPETKIYGVETVSRTIMSIVIVQRLFISRPIHSIFIDVLFFISIRNHCFQINQLCISVLSCKQTWWILVHVHLSMVPVENMYDVWDIWPADIRWCTWNCGLSSTLRNIPRFLHATRKMRTEINRGRIGFAPPPKSVSWPKLSHKTPLPNLKLPHHGKPRQINVEELQPFLLCDCTICWLTV